MTAGRINQIRRPTSTSHLTRPPVRGGAGSVVCFCRFAVASTRALTRARPREGDGDGAPRASPSSSQTCPIDSWLQKQHQYPSSTIQTTGDSSRLSPTIQAWTSEQDRICVVLEGGTTTMTVRSSVAAPSFTFIMGHPPRLWDSRPVAIPSCGSLMRWFPWLPTRFANRSDNLRRDRVDHVP